MPEINPVTKDQLFEKKIAENTGSNYNVGDISDVVPVTKDQALLKEIALNSAGQSGDITELEGKVADNTSAIEAIVNEYSAKNYLNVTANSETRNGVTLTVNADKTVTLVTDSGGCTQNTAFRLSTPVLPIGKKMIFTDEIETYPDKVTAYYAQQIDGSWTTYSHNTEFTVGNYTDNACTIEVRAGALFTTPITFKPMIRDARITDPTYVPYSMTNEQLTEICDNIPAHLFVDKTNEIIPDFDVLPTGFFAGSVDNTTQNCPDTQGAAFLIFTVGGEKQYPFYIQIAVCYSTNKSYIRYCWATWSAWIQISN